MHETLYMPGAPASSGRRRRPDAESPSSEMAAALLGRPRLELLEDFDGGGSSVSLDRGKLGLALRRDEESLMWLDLGCLDAAEQCCREAAALFEELDGLEHPDGAIALYRLAAILRGQSRYHEAEDYAARAASIMDRIESGCGKGRLGRKLVGDVKTEMALDAPRSGKS